MKPVVYFGDGIITERKYQKYSRKIYKRLGIGDNCIRYRNFNTPSGRVAQLDGIDVELSDQGRIKHVQEKFRTNIYPDMMVEIADQIDETSQCYRPGWIYKDKADVLNYFMIDEYRDKIVLYIIDEPKLREYLINHEVLLKCHNWLFEPWYKVNNMQLEDILPFTIRPFKSKSIGFKGEEWSGFCIKIGWSDLESIGVVKAKHVFTITELNENICN